VKALRDEAIKMLRELRGMDPCELCTDEVKFVENYLQNAYSKGWLDGRVADVAQQHAPPFCETCSDGGHGDGK